MNHRDRALQTFAYAPTDRVPLDIMENNVWRSLQAYFAQNHGSTSLEDTLRLLDIDFRWLLAGQTAQLGSIGADADGTDAGGNFNSKESRLLASAETVADVERLFRPDPGLVQYPDFSAARQCWPDHALVYCPVWMPIFSGACDAFGMAEAMMHTRLAPELFQAYAEIQCNYAIEVFRRGFVLGAAEHCDFAWLGDDFCDQQGPLIDPASWRALVKPYLERMVAELRRHGKKVLFHSCGAVRTFIPDFIEIGIDGLLVVQTSAAGMTIEGLARDFGGQIVFYGGIDAQQLLTQGSPEEVAREVKRNCRAFAHCGGYVVANSHHSMPDISGRNIEAMCHAAWQARTLYSPSV